MTESHDPRRLLVIANRTCPCRDVLDDIRRRAGDGGEVLLVAPALNTRLRHWVSDTDGALADARERLDRAMEYLHDEGVEVRGEVGDADPLLAIEDALVGFDAAEIIISTWPEGQSNWLERNLIVAARERFDRPIVHLVSHYGAAEPVAS
jgi:GABA permease